MPTKRLIILAILLVFLLTATQSFAATLFDEQTAISDALNNSSGFYHQQNPDGQDLKYVSVPVLSDYTNDSGQNFGCLIYGQPHGDTSGGQSRYLGYTLTGEDFTNVSFPPDVTHIGYFESQNWIFQPWKNPDVRANYTIYNNNNLDGSDQYKPNIMYGIYKYYTDLNNINDYQVKGFTSDTQDFWNNIAQYVHILAPPTKYAWGIGRMWRINNGQINYVTVPILPNALLPQPVNLKVNSITLDPASGTPGQAVSGVISVTNESKKAFTATKTIWIVRHQDSSELIRNTIISDLAAGETKTLPFSFTPDVAGTYSVATMINPDHTNPPNETNFLSGDWPGDNRVEVPYNVKGKDYDISVQILQGNPYGSYTLSTSENPAKMFVNVMITRKDDLPGSLPVHLTITGGDQTVEKDITLDPGGNYVYEIYNITAYQSGSYNIEAQAWPSDSSWSDIYPEDNVDRMTLTCNYVEPPKPRDRGIRVDIIGTEKY